MVGATGSEPRVVDSLVLVLEQLAPRVYVCVPIQYHALLPSFPTIRYSLYNPCISMIRHSLC